ncbi:MAG: aat [Bacteroidetes bacterium]|nr:aat [Bacteroidota bacterium]
MTGTRRIHSRLDAATVLTAYRAGYFPMADHETRAISWYSPDPRAIIPLDKFPISRSLRHTINKHRFEVRLNTAFENVIRACADREETWISDEIITVYTELHRLGHAHSVESWLGGVLAGGLYGVAIGGAFFGESMFSRKADASKVALVFLVRHLQDRGFGLLDSQFINDHIRRFGAVEIRRSDYLARLRGALSLKTGFGEPTKDKTNDANTR